MKTLSVFGTNVLTAFYIKNHSKLSHTKRDVLMFRPSRFIKRNPKAKIILLNLWLLKASCLESLSSKDVKDWKTFIEILQYK